MQRTPSSPASGLDFEAFWAEWMPRAAAYLRVFSGLSAEDREELAAEALGRSWLHREELDPARPFAPWFFAILRRLAVDLLSRPRAQAYPPEHFEAEASSHPEAEETLIREETADFVRRFVHALPQPDRELASLVYGQGLGIGEAASLLGLKRGTASWRLSGLRRALKRAWEGTNG